MTSPPVVSDNAAEQRFEIHLGDDLAGILVYQERSDDQLLLRHTQVQAGFEGQGVGSALIGGALGQVRARGLWVLPACPFVQAYLQRHPDDLDLVPASARAEYGLPAA